MLALVTGEIDESLLARVEYLIEENRVLRNQLQQRVRLTDAEKRTLAEKAVLLGKLTADTVTIVKPETILKWHTKLAAERNHQGIGNVIPFPDDRLGQTGSIGRAERLGGLLSFYHRAA